ncbi:hypothetical protein DSECCO2_659670 [anaerobic digester metagenome]
MTKKENSKRTTVLLLLIPCGFTLLNLLIFGLQNLLTDAGVSGNIMIPLLLLTMVALFIFWVYVGSKSYTIQKNYGKALLLFNGIGIICLIFALIYYLLTPMTMTVDGFVLVPYGFTAVPVLDVIAGLYSGGFIIGSIFAVSWFTSVSYPLVAIILNTLIGLVLFSAGYLGHLVSAKQEEQIYRKIKESAPAEEGETVEA